ncbi:MAG: hypothetical protein JXB05_14065 [Myxococcaceae bacterium]|nr:hypothetical protein [Myxococcaceae bacterium]
MPLMTAEEFKSCIADDMFHMLPVVAHFGDILKPLFAALDTYHSSWNNWLTYYGSSK